jgi:hypothetical protein
MPSDMTMKWPSTGIVRCHLDDDVGVGWDDLNIATLGIKRVGEGSAGPVASSWSPCSQDKEIVPVKMDWVCGYRRVVDDEADGGVGAEVVDVPLDNVSARRKGGDEDLFTSGS